MLHEIGGGKITALHVHTKPGGFYKFYPEDTRYVYETFRQDSNIGSFHYIDQGITVGPVNGEMNFVEDMVRGHRDNSITKDEVCP